MISSFIDNLDKDVKVGPSPLSGYSFEDVKVENMLDCSHEVAMKLFTEPSVFQFDEQDQVYIDVEDESSDSGFTRLYIDSDAKSAKYSAMCTTIAEALPKITFDIECGGYPSRQIEAASLYKVCVVNALCEGQYEKQINKILKTYDFGRMSSSNGETPFTNLLKEMQEESDSITKVILMCCTTKLVAASIKKDTSYKGWLREDDSERLRLAAEKDATINFEYNERFKRALSVKDKILIGESYAEEREKLVSSFDSDLSILFAIYKLDMNAIPGRAKRKIRNAANAYVEELIENGEIEKDVDVIGDFKKKLIRRAQKLFLSRMKIIRYKMWNDGIREDLLPKY